MYLKKIQMSLKPLQKMIFLQKYLRNENADIFSNFIYQRSNNMTDVCIFPISPKLPNITPVFIKRPQKSKKNQRPVSILLNISKIYENQMSSYFENIFSNFQCGLMQGLSAQYCMMSMTEKWKKFTDKENFCCPPYRPIQSFQLSPT